MWIYSNETQFVSFFFVVSLNTLWQQTDVEKQEENTAVAALVVQNTKSFQLWKRKQQTIRLQTLLVIVSSVFSSFGSTSFRIFQ